MSRIDDRELKERMLVKDTFTIPSVQKEFGVDYGTVRACVEQLLTEGNVQLQEGLTYRVRRASSVPHHEDLEPDFSDILDDDDDDDETDADGDNYKSLHAALKNSLGARKRNTRANIVGDPSNIRNKANRDLDFNDLQLDKDYQELSTIYAQLCAGIPFDLTAPLPQIHFSESKPLLPSVDLGVHSKNMRKIERHMAKMHVPIAPCAICFTLDRALYVYKYLSPDSQPSMFVTYTSSIRYCLGTDDVDVIAPYDNDKVAVSVKLSMPLDPLCKRALCFWLRMNGVVSELALLRACRGIGGFRMYQLINQMADLGCLTDTRKEPNSHSAYKVCVTRQEIDALFPKALGWYD